MKLVPRCFRFFVLILLCAGPARASFLVDPTGGTVLWSDEYDKGWDDAVVRGRALGFEFSFFEGDPVTSIDVCTNGNLNFSGDPRYDNELVGLAVARISPLWDDLKVVSKSGDSVIEKTVAGKLYSVTWRVHEVGLATTRHAFQVVLFGAAMRINGLDFAAGDIVFSYESLGPTFAKDTATVGLDAGDEFTLLGLPGAVAETGVLARSEAGLLPVNAGGFVLFHPDEAGGYEVSIHINRTPVAVDDTQYSKGRSRFTIDALANDSDPEGDPLTIVSVTQGSFGNVEINAEGRIVYTPGPIFAGTDIFTYTVRDPYGLTATARVTVLPFGAGRGTFDGLFLVAPSEDDPEPETTNETSGYLKLALTASGGFTATVSFGGFTRSVRGTFDARGDFSISFQREVDGEMKPVSIALHLNLADETAPLTGLISDGETTARLQAGRTRFTAAFPTGLAGKYTMLLQPDEFGSAPPGIGYAQMKVTPAGLASLVGKLGDGRSFSAGSSVKPDGSFPLYLSLKTGAKTRAGSLFGIVKFDATQPASDCTAALRWFMPDFDAVPQMIGSRYVAPRAGKRVLNLANTAGNAAIDLGDGQITEVLTLDSSNKVSTQGSEQIAVSINAGAGLFSGRFAEESFDDPPVMQRRSFGGVFLPKANLGGGLYLDADKVGAAVRITPSEP